MNFAQPLTQLFVLVNVDTLTYQNQLKSDFIKWFQRLALILINFGIPDTAKLSEHVPLATPDSSFSVQ